MSSVSESRLSDIIDALYAGSGDPREWPGLLGPICTYLDAEVGQVVVGDHTRSRWDGDYYYALTPNRDEADLTDFLAAHGATDPRRKLFLASEGRVWLDHEMEPPGFDASPIVRDFLDPLEIRRQIAAVVVRDETTIATLTVMRSRAAGPFTAVHADRFSLLLPHFRRSFHIHKALRQAAGVAQGAAAFVESLDNPVILCNGGGQVVLANEAARALSRQGALSLRGGRLSLPRAADEGRLNACIAAVFGHDRRLGRGKAGHEPCGAMGIAVPRPDPKPPLRLLVCPLPGAHALADASPGTSLVALVGVGDTTDRPLGTLLASLYDLTAAETRLVDQLRRGLSLKEAADALGVAHSTTRTQLANVFAKTQTSRQSELVGLVGRVASLQAPL
ncbi:helix-turn-helix transcriptional regulator [Salinarimonas soli]|uniref:Helix-turn-helix transcriptional regulator n=1 Tax=Salinarimonas soli TaxID=1638099 RepID=A0A5B2VR56_9HYPH|nr:helix-turn-helix transcriptional regulator [Salinarimonas soli]KAA2242263.1 helix-turn-helix transcriptional regulator [Salinarimonas soli]